MTWLPAPLETPRLLLRPLRSGDEDAVAALFSDAEGRRYLGGAMSKRRARRRAAVVAEGATERLWGHFAVVERSSDAVIGMAGFDDRRGPWQLTYEVRREWWGRGMAGEAVRAILDWFRTQRPDAAEVIAVTQAANARSCRMLERLGGEAVREFVEFGEVQREYVLRLGALE